MDSIKDYYDMVDFLNKEIDILEKGIARLRMRTVNTTIMLTKEKEGPLLGKHSTKYLSQMIELDEKQIKSNERQKQVFIKLRDDIQK
jgi:hypothetical protein